MENRRLLLAAFLSALVMIAWNYYMVSITPPPEDPAPIGDQAGPTAGQGETPDGRPAEEGDPQGAGDRGQPDREQPTVGAADAGAGEDQEPEPPPPSLITFTDEVVTAMSERVAILENDDVRAEFTNLGAQLISLRLKNYLSADGEPLELVRPRGIDPYPFALVVDGDKSHRLNKALFKCLKVAGERLRCQHRSERGAAEKVFGWSPDGLLEATVTVDGRPGWAVLLGPGVRRLDEGEKIDSQSPPQVTYQVGESTESLLPKNVEEDVFLSGRIDWVALEDKFFLNATLPIAGVSDIIVRPVEQRQEVSAEEPRFLPAGSGPEGEELDPELMILVEAAEPRVELLSYFGAKNYRQLIAQPYGFEKTIHWGSFIGLIARPLYFCLEWIYTRMIPNYGWAIILTTCLIRILFFPLTHKGQMSMMKMQELGPKVNALKAKYRSKLKDRQGRPNVEAQRELNDEIMKIYKKAGVNPVGGCLPMLLQMPVFFAFFRLLSTSVELRGAPWILWVVDLSKPDPWVLPLPVIMTVTALLMQRMMPPPPDPMQRRMMQMMPLMFGGMAFFFPAGLLLYWITNNLLSMAQQALMIRIKKRYAEAKAPDGDGDDDDE